MGVLGGVFVLKSGLRILIRAPQVPFLVPPKMPILGVFGYFGGTVLLLNFAHIVGFVKVATRISLEVVT